MLIFLILLVVSSVGMVVFFWRNIPTDLLHFLVAFGGGVMLSVSLVHIVPESLEKNPLSIFAFLGGFLVMYLLEELLSHRHHDHHHGDHVHEDPHEHINHVALIAWIAISLHTIFDGIGIGAGMDISRDLGIALFLGVMLHQIPVSLSIASLFRRSHLPRHQQMIFFMIFALMAPIGYIVASSVLPDHDLELMSILTALAGGSLLYVSNVEFLPIIHAQTTARMRYVTVALFLLGAIGMSAMHFFE